LNEALPEGALLYLELFDFQNERGRGIPSLAAAPFGPATFRLLSARAVSMSFFS